jgi:glyoxylate carboligase
MFDTSEILTESLDDLEYQAIDIKAIVHRIASIVITTISSTSVNQLFVASFLLSKGKEFRMGLFL